MHKIYIGGQWVDGASGDEPLPVINPSNGEVFDQVTAGSAADIDRAVCAAHAALDGDWGRLTAAERGRVLIRFGQEVLARAEELARLEARDTGKTLTQARADIAALARYFEFFGAAADKVHGLVVPYLNDYHVAVVREPYGVTGHILPWNYPAQMLGRTLAPALAMGNAAVLKPSEDACLTALLAMEIAEIAGLPAGTINVVTGTGEVAGAALASHRDVNYLSFTGSPEVGTLVQRAAAEHHVKCVLELGGKSPQIVFDDADLDRAVPMICKAIIQNTGQTCSAGSRLLIQRCARSQTLQRLTSRHTRDGSGVRAADQRHPMAAGTGFH